jgi:CRP/FNR family nitrogen fixation transcriptional regulator
MVHDLEGAFGQRRHPVSRIADALRAMGRMGVPIPFARDEEIYGQDEDAAFIYRVLSGAVRTSRLMSDGRRQIGDFYRKGDLFGFETRPEHRFAAEALQTCKVLVVKRSTLQSTSGDLDCLYSAANNRELDRAQDHLLLLGRKNACEKVASLLLDLVSDDVGESIDLPMGRQDMADYLGLSIETVSRMLSQLQTRFVVSFSATRQFRVTDLSALARLAA